MHVGGFFGETLWRLDERREKKSRWKNTGNREKTKRKEFVDVGRVGSANHCLHSFYFRKRRKNEKEKKKNTFKILGQRITGQSNRVSLSYACN